MAIALTIALLGFGLALIFYLAHKYGIIDRTLGATEKAISNLFSSEGETRKERERESLKDDIERNKLESELNFLKNKKDKTPEKTIDSKGNITQNLERKDLDKKIRDMDYKLKALEEKNKKNEEREKENEETGKKIREEGQRDLSIIKDINEDLTNLGKTIKDINNTQQEKILADFQTLYISKAHVLNKAITEKATLSKETLDSFKRYNEQGFQTLIRLKEAIEAESKVVQVEGQRSVNINKGLITLLNRTNNLISQLNSRITDTKLKKQIIDYEEEVRNIEAKSKDNFSKTIVPSLQKYIASFETIERLINGFLYSLEQEKKYLVQPQIDQLEFAKFSSNQLNHLAEISTSLKELEQPRIDLLKQISEFSNNTKAIRDYYQALTKITP